MKTESFKPIAIEALREILEEKHARGDFGWMRWPDENVPSNIVVTELCAMLGEGLDENRIGLGEICIPKHIDEAEAKQEIKRQIDALLPRYRHE